MFHKVQIEYLHYCYAQMIYKTVERREGEIKRKKGCVCVLCVHVSFILTITVIIALNEGLVLCVTIN